MSITVNVIAAKITAKQLADVLSSVQAELATASASSTPADTLAMSKRLAAAAAAANGTASTADTSALAGTILALLVSSSSINNINSTSSTASMLMTFNGVGTMWSLASSNSRASALTGVSALSAKLATQQLAVEDAQPVAEFFSTVLGDAMGLVQEFAASAGNGAAGVAARALAAHDVLASVVLNADSLTRGLLKGATCNGTAVLIATARISASVQCVTAALAATGSVSSSLPSPPGVSSVSSRRRSLMASSNSNSNTAATVSMSVNPAIAPLCAADATCASAGLDVTTTVLADTSLLLTALSGTAVPLVTNLSDYKAGGAVNIISHIVRVAAPGLPSSAIGLSGLVTLNIPINSTASKLRGANARRAIDVGVVPVDPSAGISGVRSVTTTSNPETVGNILDTVSGNSNNMGDFVVVEYESTTKSNGGSSSALPELGSNTGAAGPALQPLSWLTATLVAFASFTLGKLL
ncbi:hypothetical protein PLESTB_001025000 [Pleodorina starrii]|uniref:Uncharacterized protein n=1 Tax=Pleodorina starrii TaxID=330485 RepID=A0A9W6F424_9CHLO|nr:hypothetical protein PLESTB_001025000 [Pleodorina starrii]